MNLKHSLKIFVTAFILSGTSSLAIAQKIQNVQETSVWAIAPVKIDGKTSDETFQAYNKSTLLFYTLSNDANNIYLVVKSTDAANNNKIMMGGITVNINPNGKKKEKDGSSITFPVIARPQRGQGGGNAGFQRPQQGQRLQGASADSAAAARRKQQLAAVKEIKVLGIKDITDSLISIYNEYGIVAVANFDEKGSYVYELAVPLKLLGLTPASKDFSYNIKVNGFQFGGGFGGGNRPAVVMTDGGGGGGGQGGGFRGGQGGGGVRGGFDPSAFLPTDFWGKYSLAKNN